MIRRDRQIMWESFSDELEKVAFGAAATRFGVGAGIGAITGGMLGSEKREGETKKDALRRGLLRGMAVGGLAGLASPLVTGYNHGSVMKHVKDNSGTYKVLGGLAVGIPAALYLKKHIEEDAVKKAQEGGM
jgi:Na+/proline symporter